MLTRLNVVFSDAQGQLTPMSAVEFCRNSYSSKLLYLSSLPARMKKIQSVMMKLVANKIFPILSLWEIFNHSRATYSAVLGRIWPNFELVLDSMVVLVICKYEEDPIKNVGARVLTRLYVVFSDAQWQLTPKSAVEFCRNSNSSKLL